MRVTDINAIDGKLNLVVNKLMNLQRPDREEEIASSMSDGGKSVGLFRRDFGMEPWDWPQGVGLYGLYNLYKQTGDAALEGFIQNWYAGHINSGPPVRNINTTAPLLTLSHMADEPGADARYREVCLDWAQWLMDKLPKTKDGGFQHTTTEDAAKGTINENKDELWIDTLFMAVLFLANAGRICDVRAYREEALKQFLTHIKYLYEKRDGLFYHGYSFARHDNFGGIYWCRGNSWFTAASMDYLEIAGDTLDRGVRDFILDTYRAQVDRLAALQGGDGLWHTVLTDPDSYTEVSGSAGIAYGMLKGLRLGLLSESLRETALRAISAIIDNIDTDGTVQNVSAGTGISMDAVHYRNIIKAPMAYGQSLVIMALAEYRRAL